MRRLPLGVLAVLLLVLGAMSSGTTAPPEQVRPAAADTGCADALLVAVPGGGQGQPGSRNSQGATLTALTEPLVARARASRRTVTTQVVSARTAGPFALRGRGTMRTAARRAVTRHAWWAWHRPVAGLASGVEDAVGQAVADCPDQLLYLAGYSHGAEAVHQFLARNADADLRSRTVAVVLVGDPARVSGTRGSIVGTPAARRRAQGVSNRFDRTPLPAVPGRGWRSLVTSVCTSGDVACDLRRDRFRRAARLHRSYSRNAGASALETLGADRGARLARFPKPATGQQETGRVGLFFTERLRVFVARGQRRHLRFTAASPLPGGLSLAANGTLSGTPTEAGSFTIDYTVRNTSNRRVSRPMPGRIEVRIAEAAKSTVSTGGRHACEIRASGTLWCWGANFYGQLGTRDRVSGDTPRQVTRLDDWVDVSAGGMHTCGVRGNGTLSCWGLNNRGQLGIGGRRDQSRPRRVGDDRDWASVSTGWSHTCATKRDGSARCWGDNRYGQLGSGNRARTSTPVRVTRGIDFREVVAGAWHTCGVARSGAAYCWGRNLNGQLGDGTLTLRINPARIGDATDWLSLAPAWTHTCGLRATGATYCWGGNEGGQLGGGRFAGTRSPREVGGDHTWSAVHTGVNFSCGLDSDQAMWCWGTGRFGQLGDTERANQPIRLFPGQTWAQFDLGWLFGCGRPGSGAATTCWGNNETGELGSVPTAARASTTTEGGPFRFNLVSLNVLGSNHTAPRRDAAEFSPARVRSEWMIDYLRSVRASVVGFQEIQRDQLDWFTRGAGDRYDVWPGTKVRGAVQTNLAWRRDQWRFLSGDTVKIPFITQTRRMPLVHLEHKRTGRQIWVMNIHNAPQGHQDQRNVAVRREIKKLKGVVGQGDPVFLVGDFNERDRAFCEVSRELGFVAPRGGSYSGGTCRPPSGRLRVDWIFGSAGVDYSRYREDRSALVQLITDHAVLRTRVSVP